jgi:hypothetical protein
MSGVRGLVIARVMVPASVDRDHVGKERLSSGSREGRKHVHVDEPLALVLRPAACQVVLGRWRFAGKVVRSVRMRRPMEM